MFSILQLCDSAFPTGGFSHSFGAEAVVRNLRIKDKDDLKNFIVASLENIGSSTLPFVKAAHEYVDYGELTRLDSLLNATLTNHVAKRASIQQGITLLCTAAESFALTKLEYVQSLVDNGKMHGHQAVIFGVVCKCMDISSKDCVKMYMFTSLRTIMASLVRLGKIGAIEAQRCQSEMQMLLNDIITRNWDKEPEESSTIFPILDVLQMCHDNMFSKLFIS